MANEIRKYSKADVTVVWQPALCIHSAKCFKGLPEVFDPKARPWVDINGASAERIIEQVSKCPSGALSIDKGDEPTPLNTSPSTQTIEIQVQLNGPLLLKGPCVIKHADGHTETKEGNIALCRCGASANKPYCDGSHHKIGFRG